MNDKRMGRSFAAQIMDDSKQQTTPQTETEKHSSAQHNTTGIKTKKNMSNGLRHTAKQTTKTTTQVQHRTLGRRHNKNDLYNNWDKNDAEQQTSLTVRESTQIMGITKRKTKSSNCKRSELAEKKWQSGQHESRRGDYGTHSGKLTKRSASLLINTTQKSKMTITWAQDCKQSYGTTTNAEKTSCSLGAKHRVRRVNCFSSAFRKTRLWTNTNRTTHHESKSDTVCTQLATPK